MHHQVLVVAQRHLQQVRSVPLAHDPVVAPSSSTAWVERQPVVMLRKLLLLDAHGVHIVTHSPHKAPQAPQAPDAHATPTVGRVSFLLQAHHLLRGHVGHDRLGGQPGEAGDRRQVAEHEHARAEAAVHAAVGPQEFAAQLVLNEAHGGWSETRTLGGMGWLAMVRMLLDSLQQEATTLIL